MITKEKIAAIQKQVRSGVPEGEIKNELRKEGYTEEEIREAFPAHRADMRSWYLVSGIIIATAGLWRFVVSESLLLLILGIGLLTLYYTENKKHQPKKDR